MEIIHKRLPVKLLELNKGQIDGLPANPRLWDRPELERLKKSLTETHWRGCKQIKSFRHAPDC